MLIVTDFVRGLRGHAAGFRYAFSRKSLLPLIALPFLIAILLFATGFYVFSAYSDVMMAYFWNPPADASGFWGALAWVWTHVVKYFLYMILFVMTYFLFMVATNVIASPFYDAVSRKIIPEAAGGEGLGLFRIVLEELKKAVFVLAVPLVLMLLPVAGQILSPLAAMVFLGWDFADFSLSRERPSFSGRLGYVRRRFFLLLGFGAPLLITILNIFLFPFAIVGATLLYRDDPMRETATGRQP